MAPLPNEAISPAYYQAQNNANMASQAFYASQKQMQQIQHEIMEAERQIAQIYQQQRTPEIMQRLEQFQQRLHYLRGVLMQCQQQQTVASAAVGTEQQQHGVNSQQQYGLTPAQKYPISQQQNVSEGILTPSSNQIISNLTESNPPVTVMQTAANQLQVIIENKIIHL